MTPSDGVAETDPALLGGDSFLLPPFNHSRILYEQERAWPITHTTDELERLGNVATRISVGWNPASSSEEG